MDENHEEIDDVENASNDSFVEDSNDDDGPSVSGEEDELQPEACQYEDLTEEEVEEIVADLLEVESKAAEAQESLEDESLAKVEVDVRQELAQRIQGKDLEKAVADEMTTYREEWEATLDELETESAHLLEQLDGAGIELPSLFKWIESQAPNRCSTEAWKKRTHWVGSLVTSDVTECVSHAETYLQTHRPVRRKLGKVLEEGASGYLSKKVAAESSDAVKENSDVDWGSFNKIISGRPSAESISFGSKHWASVYLASTPQQAAELGLKFPGVDEVEEIDDIDDDSSDPFVADAVANENQFVLSETQRKNFRKVKEEDDANIDRKLHVQLKRRRLKNRSQKEPYSPMFAEEADFHSEGDQALKNDVDERMDVEQIKVMGNGDSSLVSEPAGSDPSEARGSKRSHKSLEVIDNEKILNVDPIVSQTDKFHCTACDEVVAEVQTHPLLKVIVCQECKCSIEGKIHVKNQDCFVGYCRWCGGSNELVSCKSCDVLFCASCVKRNLGEECFSRAKVSGWQCCCCIPSILQHLTLQLEKAIGSVEIASSSDSDSDSSDGESVVSIRSKRKRKKRIRRILDDAELGEETKKKIAIEKERQERLKSLKAHSKSMLMNSGGSNWNLSEGGSIEVLGDALTGYIVNVVREKGEEAVRIPRSISGKLKVHQVAGIRFMWENIIQSVTKAKSGDKGLGCILAHTMGLGKTFQVIAFLYTAMRCVDLGLRTALIVTPVSVQHNWRKEFDKWRPSELKPLRVYMLEDVTSERRSQLLQKWRTKGGIFLISYSSFRNLSFGKGIKDINIAKEISCALQDGPDILVCDEAHTIKNTRAHATQALKQVKCQRRIALTGSPLQNNLMEYYCMVDFVREGFLGSSHEFKNRFQNPIENGQHTNSTTEDVKIMNQRSHILYEQLKGFVQRMDMNVMKKDLPSKTVFVIAVKLSTLQRKLYKRFLDVHGFTSGNVSIENNQKRSFFAGYQALAQISNHPGVLQLTRENKDYGKSDIVEKLLVEESSSDENINANMIAGDNTGKRNDVAQKKNENSFLYEDWWNDLSKENNYKIVDNGGKMVLLLDILTMSAEVGDKVLVFSQFLSTLDLIERYLSKMPQPGKKGKCWKRGKDWYRLDGKTESLERQRLVERFNDPSNTRVKCTLISTRAGSLGINLHAANRVVIVDGSWNPTYDLQAIYRAWRYGQRKPVFAYRLLAHGTMEEKIYKRQVTKEGLAARVVDRQQVHRTISKEEMLHLFEFGDDENLDSLSDFGPENGQGPKSSINGQKLHLSHGNCSSDKLMESLLNRHKQRWIANYHEHETLLQENEDEKLSKEEQDMAWEVYRKTFEWEEVQRVPVSDPLTKPSVPKRPSIALENAKLAQTKARIRNHLAPRKCTNLSHLLTLRSQGIKAGCTTICGECAQEISSEELNKSSS